MKNTIIFLIIAIISIACSGKKGNIKKTSSEFIFNLPSYQIATNDDRYGMVSLSLHYSSEIVQAEINNNLTTINKSVSTVLHKKRYLDANTRDKQDKILNEIKILINGLLKKGEINKVSIRELVIN